MSRAYLHDGIASCKSRALPLDSRLESLNLARELLDLGPLLRRLFVVLSLRLVSFLVIVFFFARQAVLVRLRVRGILVVIIRQGSSKFPVRQRCRKYAFRNMPGSLIKVILLVAEV